MSLSKAFSLFIGWTTPFMFTTWPGAVAAASAAQPTGRWLFVDDASGIEIAPCLVASDGLCGTLVKLPKSAEPLAAELRKQLCGLTILGSLKVSKPERGERQRLDGWVLNPEDVARTAAPRRYEVSLIVMSEVSAKLEVRGPFGIVLESHRLMRPVAPAVSCE